MIHKNINTNKSKIKGFSSIEYLVITSLLVTVLFVGDPNLASLLVDAFKKFYSSLTYIISLP